ncbi:MAG: hypothetical protein H7A55_09305 [Verrucomicrobiaceae bacterium]|nr:hypothetical protein [Verrucomicrobiaceae bacterium]
MKWLVLLGAMGALGWGLDLQAAPKFSGAVNYQFGAQNATVSISCGGITNSSAENATGTLMVKLWALRSPYAGGTLNGHLLGSFRLEGLAGGRLYKAMTKTVQTTLPPALGNYYLCLTLLEYRSGGYVIVDSRNFQKVVSLGPAKLFTLAGPWKWQTSYEGGTVTMQVGKISHTRRTRTGTLRLALWATKQPYRGGDISGFELGRVEKKALEPGYSYTDVQNTAKLQRPPGGTYYLAIVLSEYDGNAYRIVAHLTSEKSSKFSAP